MEETIELTLQELLAEISTELRFCGLVKGVRDFFKIIYSHFGELDLLLETINQKKFKTIYRKTREAKPSLASEIKKKCLINAVLSVGKVYEQQTRTIIAIPKWMYDDIKDE